ncbi:MULTISPECIES: hypothetical protein [unclassified Amycolatopsis]|uniref:hypothetical protein n=1 Tax=unclassified Amycolatopsis TaxID=2618356 RepID=UPI0018F3D28F|nr:MULTISPECIES: hypothetical protein [unclassified Amycolatopsis]
MRGKIAFDARLRPTSSAESLPWLARTVTLLRVGADGVVTQAKTDADKRAMLGAAEDRDLLVVAWPGEWSQDLFVVDDLAAARLALGLPRRRVVTPTAPADSPPEPRLDEDRPVAELRDLWGRLAELPDLPEEGKRQLIDKAARRVLDREIKPLLARVDLDLEVRQRLLAGVEWWGAADLVADDCCTAAEALELLNRFPAKASVLAAALRRADIEKEAVHKIAALSYDDAAELWWDTERWSAPARTRVASSVLEAVLGSPPPEQVSEAPGWGSRRDQDSLLRGLIGELPSSRREELLRDPEHGSRVRRAFLAAEELDDAELLECLPELKTAQADEVVVYLKRFPRFAELARDEVGDRVARLIAEGWDPVRVARAGEWTDLVAVARAATTSACIDALIRAASVDGQTPRKPAHYELVDAIVGNAASSSSHIRFLLDRLSDDHVRDIHESLPARSRTRRLCAEILTARNPPAAQSVKSVSSVEPLPTDKELAAVADPVAVLADLLGDRSRNREVVVAHVLGSAHMTDELAWRMPVRDLERHPVYGPRLAAKVAEICGDSPGRWEAFAAAWRTQTQLLATTLFKRIEAGRD